MVDISVVIPVRDEEGNIPNLVGRLTNVLTNMKVVYEIIFVTDINKDRTFEVLKEINCADNKVKVVKLSNSFGQHVAVVAGLNVCSGNAVVIMDGDLQDFPEDISQLYSKLLEGYDIVYGIKEKKNDSLLRNIFSKLFVSVMAKLSDIKMDYNTSMFRIISRRTVNEILRFEERSPSLTFIMSLIGFPTASVKVSSGERQSGNTKYNFFSLINLSISFILSFSTKPIRIISSIGFWISGLSILYMIITLVQRLFFDIVVLGWSTIISLITFIGGIQLLCMGIIGEYTARIFIESKKRPLFIIDKKVGDFKCD